MNSRLTDPAPRYEHHPDKGCEFAPSCLNCPFSKCKYDEPGIGIAKIMKRDRNAEIIKRFKNGESRSDLAIAFGLSYRVIQRIVKDHVSDG